MSEFGLKLIRHLDTGALTASFRADPQASAPDTQAVMDALTSQGWTGAALNEQALEAFLSACQREQEHLTLMREVARCEREAQAAASVDGADGVDGVDGADGAVAALVDPVDPVSQVAPVAPVAPVVPVTPVESIKPVEPVEPPEPALVEAVIGKVLDGSFKLAISPDKMALSMDLSPAQGGRAVTADQVYEAAKRIGVGIALNEDALQAALAQGQGEGVVIAEGQPAQSGTPTVFKSLLDSLRPTFTELDDKARVDFRKLGTLLIVSPGQALMRRIPAQQGWPGTNVLGETIAVPRLPDAGYARGLSGVKFDERDPDVLRADIAGSPVVVHHGVKVSPVIEIDNVDLSSGNIEFDGALRVRGDVKSGMAVRVAGDVIVQGTVEAADIQAGGNITVEGGIIGAGDGLGSAAPDGQPQVVRVDCKGTIQARFINHAHVSAGGDVVVEREILNSEVLAGGQVTVGTQNATRGSIAGGRCCAMTLVRAPRLGTPGGIATHIQVGLDPYAERRRTELSAAREKLQQERAKVEKLMAFLKANPARAVDGLGERSRATYLKILEELAALEVEAVDVAKNMMRTEGVAIEVTQLLYSGVTLQVANRRYEMRDDYGRSRAMWHNDEVVVGTLG